MAENQRSLDNVNAKELDLWKVSIPVDDTFNVHQLCDGPIYGRKKLSPVYELSEVFLDPPVRKCLHILVRLPPPGECECLVSNVSELEDGKGRIEAKKTTLIALFCITFFDCWAMRFRCQCALTPNVYAGYVSG